MKIGIVGAGAMGSYVAKEIARSAPEVALAIADADLNRAEKLAGLVGPTSRAVGCNAADTGALATGLEGCAVVVNAAQYDVNLDVMRACLAAGAHYLDLGGMFHMTRRQLGLASAFEQAKLTAVLGMGAAPGITNVLARHACEQLERVDAIACSFATVAPAAPPGDCFVPPYSIRTIMQEFCEESMQFLDGAIAAQPPLAGRRTVTFPAPIGAVDCVYTLHSEPATLPSSFGDKGVREVTWRLGLPAALETQIAAFAAAGLGRSQPMAIGNAEIAPVEFLAACIEDNIRRQPQSVAAFTEFGCIRLEAAGRIGDRPTAIVIDCLYHAAGSPPDVAAVMTGTPAAIAALMLARGEAGLAGVHGAELAIPSDLMIGELRRRGFRITQTVHTAL